jgi:hypothetical protein
MLVRVWLLVSALLPLDIAVPNRPAPTGAVGQLHIEASAVGRRIRAQLVNDGPRVRLLFAYSCSGPEPFRLVVDRLERHFGAARDCDKNVERVIVLAPGERSEAILSEPLDGATHRVIVKYLAADSALGCDACFGGTLRSPSIVLAAATTTDRSVPVAR